VVDALVEGGVVGIEITYSTPNAESVVRKLKKKYGDRIMLGMGTVTTSSQAKSAMEAGANFLVSPICDVDLVRSMVATGLATMAGALTPTEIFQTYQLGVDIIKVFPGSLTGPSYIKAVHGPLPQIPMMPTGGVSKSNIAEWFAAGAIAVGAGSAICPSNLVRDGKFYELSKHAAEFVKIVKQSKKIDT